MNEMTTSAQQKSQKKYDRWYQLPITPWGDRRIPEELSTLATETSGGGRTLELGCGTGTFSVYLAGQGFRATGVDFSPIAIRKAKERAASAGVSAEFIVGDVTDLGVLGEPFDLALDIGCFHCLTAAQQQQYAAELARLTRPGSTLLVWAMDSTPPEGRGSLSPEVVEEVFSTEFSLERAEASRRRLAVSHWYWLVHT
jgi:ubiquinone/menaquinone biosynthesis C-methylase UbiE